MEVREFSCPGQILSGVSSTLMQWRSTGYYASRSNKKNFCERLSASSLISSKSMRVDESHWESNRVYCNSHRLNSINRDLRLNVDRYRYIIDIWIYRESAYIYGNYWQELIYLSKKPTKLQKTLDLLLSIFLFTFACFMLCVSLIIITPRVAENSPNSTVLLCTRAVVLPIVNKRKLAAFVFHCLLNTSLII